ncbi:MAG: hypothetical protein R3C45_09205 [Phycisphaerales bacterium]
MAAKPKSTTKKPPKQNKAEPAKLTLAAEPAIDEEMAAALCQLGAAASYCRTRYIEVLAERLAKEKDTLSPEALVNACNFLRDGTRLEVVILPYTKDVDRAQAAADLVYDVADLHHTYIDELRERVKKDRKSDPDIVAGPPPKPDLKPTSTH